MTSGTVSGTPALVRAVSAASRYRVAVLGDVMLDSYEFCYTNQSKLIPSEKVGKVAYLQARSNHVLGGAANTASNLRSLGVNTFLIGFSGTDGIERRLRDLCDVIGIEHSFIEDPARPSTVKMRVYVDDAYQFRMDKESTTPATDNQAYAILRELESREGQVDAVLVSDYKKGFFTPYLGKRLVELCGRWKVPLIVDCKPGNEGWFAGASIICVNQGEAEKMLGRPIAEGSREHDVKELSRKLRCEKSIVTHGSRGLSGVAGDVYSYVPGRKVVAVDAVGAGDTVRAALAVGLLGNLGMSDLLSLANLIGSLVVMKVGTSPVTQAEVLAALKG